MRILLLSFNGQIFYTIFDVFEHICDYLKGKKYARLYLDIVKQASNMFDLDSAFETGLIKTLKKDNVIS